MPKGMPSSEEQYNAPDLPATWRSPRGRGGEEPSFSLTIRGPAKGSFVFGVAGGD